MYNGFQCKVAVPELHVSEVICKLNSSDILNRVAAAACSPLRANLFSFLARMLS